MGETDAEDEAGMTLDDEVNHYAQLAKDYRLRQESAADSDDRIVYAALADQASAKEAELHRRARRNGIVQG